MAVVAQSETKSYLQLSVGESERISHLFLQTLIPEELETFSSEEIRALNSDAGLQIWDLTRAKILYLTPEQAEGMRCICGLAQFKE